MTTISSQPAAPALAAATKRDAANTHSIQTTQPNDSITLRFGQAVDPAVARQVAKGHQAFTANLMNALGEEATSKSLAWSSFNLYGLLMGVAGGSDRLHSALGLPADASTADVNKALRTRIKELSARAAEQEITLRNEMGIWVNSQGQDPTELLTGNFRRGAEAMEAEVDAFAPDYSVDPINTWVSERTNGKIPKLLEPGTLGPYDSALLANVFYLLANWTEQFSPDLTKEKPFKTPDNADGANVQMMQKGGLSPEEQQALFERLQEKGVSGRELWEKLRSLTGNPEVRYAETKDYQAASLDFGKKEGSGRGATTFSLNLVVPTEVDGLKSVYNSLAEEGRNGDSKLQNLMDELAGTWPTELKTLQLPKFKMTEEVDWMPVMDQLGIPLNGLNITQEQFREFVSKMKGKSFVDVNEKGAEMAFADFAVVTRESVPMPPQKQLIADRPFMWVFTAQKDGKAQVLAQGTIVTPPKYEQ